MKKNGGSKSGGAKGSKSNNANELIRENMKCPVCLEVLLPPIYQCETGHNICYSCVEEVHECPLCKGDYGDTRNYFAEELVNSMTFPCKYEEFGCTVSCLGSELKEHQENCECQPYQCPELACKELVGLNQMQKHLDKHGYKAMTGESHQATLDIQDTHFDKKTEYNPWRVSVFNREFYTVATRQKDKTWYFWTWVLALPKDSKKYSVELVIYSGSKQVLYRGSVHSLRTSAEDVIKTGNCLILTDSLIKSMREENKLSMKIRFLEGKNWEGKKGKGKKATVANTKESRKNVLKIKHQTSFSGLTRIISSPNSPGKIVKKTSALSFPLKKVSGSSSAVAISPKGAALLPNKAKINGSPKTAKKPTVSEAEHSFVMKMRESLKCPGCNTMIGPPIYQCNIGHCVCESCRTKREDCPLCRAPVCGVRNFFAEELLYRAVQKCRYHGSGCDVCLPAVQIRFHENSCEFAPFECPFSSCRKKFQPKELLEHMKSHDIPLAKSCLSLSVPVPKPGTNSPICSIPSIINIPNATAAFYPLIVREPNGIWSFWVASNDVGKYTYELTIKKQTKILVFQSLVLSLRLNPSQILLNGDGLLTTDKCIKNLKTDKKFEYSLKVAPVKNFTKSGSSFLIPPPCTFDKTDDKNGNNPTALELFANKRTSISPEEEESDSENEERIFRGGRRRTSAPNLFTNARREEESGSESEVSGSSSTKKQKGGGSKAASSSQKSATESLSSFSEGSEFTDEEMEIFMEDSFELDEDELPSTSPSSLQLTVPAESCENLVKKKSALKVKDSTLESTSQKKVEFNPMTQIFNEIPKVPDENQNFTEKKEEKIVNENDLTLHENNSPVKSNSVVPILRSSSETLPKLNLSGTKVETFSRSCVDLKNGGTREGMKNRLESYGKNLTAIREEDENDDSGNVDKKTDKSSAPKSSNVQKIASVPELSIKSVSGQLGIQKGKSVTNDLIDFRSTEKIVTQSAKSSTSINIGSIEGVGNLELIIHGSKDKITSISLNDIDKERRGRETSSDRVIPQFLDDETNENVEYVEESDTACQVGSSLEVMRVEAEEEFKLKCRSESLNDLNIAAGYEAVAEGLNSTITAVKEILSGMIPNYTGDSNVKKNRGRKGGQHHHSSNNSHGQRNSLSPKARLPHGYGKKK